MLKILGGVAIAVILGLIAGIIVLALNNKKLTKGHTTRVNALKEEHSAAMAELESQHAEALQALQDRVARGEASRAEIEQASREATELHNQLVAQMRERHSAALEQTSQRLQNECAASVAQLENAHGVEISEKQATIRDLETEKTAIQTSCAAAQTQAESDAAACAADRTAAASTMSQLRLAINQMNADVEQLRVQFQQQIETLAADHQTRMENISALHQEAITALGIQHNEQIQRLAEAHADQIAQLETQLQQRTDATAEARRQLLSTRGDLNKAMRELTYLRPSALYMKMRHPDAKLQSTRDGNYVTCANGCPQMKPYFQDDDGNRVINPDLGNNQWSRRLEQCADWCRSNTHRRPPGRSPPTMRNIFSERNPSTTPNSSGALPPPQPT